MANQIQGVRESPKTARNNENTIPRIGKSGTNGTRNVRGMSGLRARRYSTPAQTTVNAISVPMLTRLSSWLSGTISASTATATPVIIVVIIGVLKRGWIFATAGGSILSRAIT